MAKLGCPCGHTIVDQTDDLRYKGYILPDVLLDKTSEKLTDAIDSLLDAINAGKRLDWIEKNFSVPPYPTNLSVSSMIHDLFSSYLIDKTQDIFECENCGRIAIQVGQTNYFRFFSPDSPDTKGILNVGKVSGENPNPDQ